MMLNVWVIIFIILAQMEFMFCRCNAVVGLGDGCWGGRAGDESIWMGW